MNPNIQLNQLNIRDILSAIFRQKLIILLLSPVIIIGTFFVLLFETPVYEASVKMHIVGRASVEADFYRDIGSTRGIHMTQMEIVKSTTVLKRAVIALQLDKRLPDYEKNFCHPLKYFLTDYKTKKINEEIKDLTPEKQREFLLFRAIIILKENLTTALIPGTDLFIIAIKDFSPDVAKSIANVVSRSYIIFDQQQQLAELSQKYGMHHASVQQLRDNIYRMTEKLSGEQLPELEAIGTASVKIIEQATSTNTPVSKSRMQILLIAILASLCVSVGICVLYDIYIDQTFKSPSEIVKHTGIPLLGSVPIRKHKDDLIINPDKFNPSNSEILYSNFYEDLSDQLLIYMKVNKLKTILITSAFSRGGASTICANIGITLAKKMHAKTLIIDANFRNPVIHKLFNLEESPGFANILEEGKLIEYHMYDKNIPENSDNYFNLNNQPANDLKSSQQEIKLPASNIDSMINHIDQKLSILQAGKASMAPITLFTENKLDVIFKLKKIEYDAVIIDSSNLRDFKDTGILSSHVDGVVLVVNDGKEKRQIVMNSISYVKQKKGNPFGIILNKRRFPIPDIIYKWV